MPLSHLRKDKSYLETTYYKKSSSFNVCFHPVLPNTTSKGWPEYAPAQENDDIVLTLH